MDSGGTEAEFDIDLLLAARAGDAAAFGQLYERHAPAVLRYAWSRAGDRGAAEELLQDTFLTAWARRRSATILDESLLPWLLVICRNHVANHLRRLARRRTDAVDPALLPAARAADQEIAWISAELDRLSELDRRVCQLCLVDSLSYREAADELDSTPAAVGKRLQRARGRLRRALGEAD